MVWGIEVWRSVGVEYMMLVFLGIIVSGLLGLYGGMIGCNVLKFYIIFSN